jgi:Zn-finger nucleic acid-binding protein/ribosomal protein L40E
MNRNLDFATSGIGVKSGPGPPDENSGERPRERLSEDRKSVRLVACGNCHTQFDVSDIVAKTFPCRCGETLENRPPAPVDAEIRRCGACGALVTPDAENCDYCSSAIVRVDNRILSLICPECYARNAEDSRFCTACGVTFRPEAVRIEGHELPCPVCSALMPPRQIGGVGINECGSCNGLWVPGENFDLLVSRAIEAQKSADPAKLMAFEPRVTGSNPASQKVQYRKCPECEGFMHRRNFRKSSGVIIDRCSTHGTWLDADELEQIAGFILSGRQPAASLMERPHAPTPAPRTVADTMFERFEHTDRRSGGGVVGSVVDALFAILK